MKGQQTMATRRKATCTVVRAEQTYTGKQALTYFAGVSVEQTSARHICMHLMKIPPGGRAKAHLHEHHETAIYVIGGEARVWHGDQLEEQLVCRAGDFVYIPANTPHLPYNSSDTETFTAVVARTDPNEQESVVLLPELDKLHRSSAVT